MTFPDVKKSGKDSFMRLVKVSNSDLGRIMEF